MGAMSAVFELTRHPGWEKDYEITVYQQGWRLGGKCASGRNPDHSWRNEEHGLHVFMGFYERLLTMLEECYEAQQQLPGERMAPGRQASRKAAGSRFKHLAELLVPRDTISFIEQVKGTQPIWTLRFKPRGTAQKPQKVADPEELLVQMRPRLKKLLMDDIIRGPQAKACSVAIDYLVRVQCSERVVLPEQSKVLEHLDTIEETRDQLASSGGEESDDSRRKRILLILGLTIFLGLLKEHHRCGPQPDFSAFDDVDFREWLIQHGATREACESVIIEAGYNLVFSKPRQFAASAALAGLTQLLRYSEHLYYSLAAGTGEVIFSPLYRVLKHRGVKFEFFHCVKALRLSQEKDRVATIEVLRQVRFKKGSVYEPLVPVKGLCCWPAQPLYDQLQDGQDLKKAGYDLEAPPQPGQGWMQWKHVEARTLELGKDFDLVILGIPVGALEPLCGDLMAHSSRFGNMVRGLHTTRTQALQAWLPKGADVGFPKGEAVVACCPRPYDTWADCSPVVQHEPWSSGGSPQAKAVPAKVFYLCGSVDEATHALGRSGEQLAREWLQAGRALFRPRQQTSRAESSSDEPLSWYHKVSDHPSDRYVLSVPGTSGKRLRADDSGFDNLFLAGDWVKTQLNAGSVEAATQAGQDAARGIGALLELEWAKPPPPLGERPHYVNIRGLATWPGPFLEAHTTLTTFYLKADERVLQGFCDKYLNAPQWPTSKFVYKPVGGFVALQWADIGRTESLADGYKGRGWMSERDVAFSVPVLRYRRQRKTLVPEGFLLLTPYLFVDSGPILVSGRETYGLPKMLGEIHMLERPEGLKRFSVKTLVAFGDDKRAEEREVFRAEYKESPRAPSQPEGGQPGSLLDALLKVAMQLESNLDLDPRRKEHLLATLGQGLRLVTLKQFRDVHGGGAAYQSIVEIPICTRSTLRQGAIVLSPEEARLSFHLESYWSLPIAKELGLTQPFQPLMVSVLRDFDFVMGEGLVVWESSLNRA
jgi:uncharacterized protein with NAD-binding domain and iron-sulfur cluster